ncbi:hypothetical protein [Bacillus pacificus]|uniref:hypothetical protein n=1 Tax=Bacillus pacificus TaxID=2026187 RepID=UPI003D6573F2
MKIPFEEWILSQEIPTDAKDLINEAIICYKADAYRASLLFSYLCFQTIIRDRMLNAHKPDNIPEGMWNDIHKKLRNEDTWDQTVFDNLQRQQPKEIFLLNDDIRNQITYWKNRRNDCAHSKNNIISVFHVENFWSFMRSNLPKIMVNGSREALLNKIKKHFDLSLTAPDTDISYIINEVPYAVEEADLSSFFEEVLKHFKDTGDFLWDISEAYLDFWEKLFSLNDEKVTKNLVTFMKDNEDLIMAYLRNFPHKVNYFALDTSFIRNLWHSKIFSTSYDVNGDLKLYCALLRNGLIDQEQLSEAHTQIIRKCKNIIPDENDFYILQENNFFSIFKDMVFDTYFLSKFDRANTKKDIIVLYLKHFPLDKQIVESITSTFAYNSYPWHLGDSLNTFFNENPEKREHFVRILKEHEIDVPGYLDSIKEAASQ